MSDALGASALAKWIANRGIAEVVVLSPHLDDGVFSAHSVLTIAQLSRRVLATVFSDAPALGQSNWAKVTGFSSTGEEFAARRIEDLEAAKFLGADCLHLGEYAKNWSPEAAQRVTRRLAESLSVVPRHSLVLLPAGAGGVVTSVQQWLRRARRIPMGAPQHGEHLMVRDGLLEPLAALGVRLGLYAELPYVWSDKLADLRLRVSALSNQNLDLIEVEPDLDAKHAAACFYRSQLVPILSRKLAYQRRVLSHRELYFLPA